MVHLIERQGVGGLDPAELMDEVRAAHNRREQEARRQVADAEFARDMSVYPLAVRVLAIQRRADRGDQECKRAMFVIHQRLERFQAELAARAC